MPKNELLSGKKVVKLAAAALQPHWPLAATPLNTVSRFHAPFWLSRYLIYL